MPKPKKPLVVITRKLPDTVETRMRELFDARLNLEDKPMSQSDLAETVKTADVLVPTVTDRIDAAVLSKAGERLKLIAATYNEWARYWRPALLPLDGTLMLQMAVLASFSATMTLPGVAGPLRRM